MTPATNIVFEADKVLWNLSGELYPGVLEMLADLKDMGKNLYIIASDDDGAKATTELLEKTGLKKFFKRVQGNEPLMWGSKINDTYDRRIAAIGRLVIKSYAEDNIGISPKNTVYVCQAEISTKAASQMKYTVVGAMWVNGVDHKKLWDVGATWFVPIPEMMPITLDGVLPRGQWKAPQNIPG